MSDVLQGIRDLRDLALVIMLVLSTLAIRIPHRGHIAVEIIAVKDGVVQRVNDFIDLIEPVKLEPGEVVFRVLVADQVSRPIVGERSDRIRWFVY